MWKWKSEWPQCPPGTGCRCRSRRQRRPRRRWWGWVLAHRCGNNGHFCVYRSPSAQLSDPASKPCFAGRKNQSVSEAVGKSSNTGLHRAKGSVQFHIDEEIKRAKVTESLSKQEGFQVNNRFQPWDKSFLFPPTATTLQLHCLCVCVLGVGRSCIWKGNCSCCTCFMTHVLSGCVSVSRTSVMAGARCLGQVTKTMKGQSSGCMRTPAAWAQVGWNAVEQRPWEHWTQQPLSRFIRFLQYTHFYTPAQGGNVGREETSQDADCITGEGKDGRENKPSRKGEDDTIG